MKSKLDAVKAANPILEIQLYLRDISQVEPDIPMVFPSGRYDHETKKTVTEFQKKFNLPATGKVDFITWNEMLKQHKICMHCLRSPKSVSCFPNNVQEYKRGDTGNLIYILQTILMNFNRKYKNYEVVQLTGVFDEQTEEAIKQFQRCSNLQVTGKVDRQTWNTLNTINETCQLYNYKH